MSKTKKTVTVDEMLNYANNQLKRTDQYATREFKSGISVMIEHILHQANRYKGFTFLNPPKGKENEKFINQSMLTWKEGDPVDFIDCNHPEFYNRVYF